METEYSEFHKQRDSANSGGSGYVIISNGESTPTDAVIREILVLGAGGTFGTVGYSNGTDISNMTFAQGLSICGRWKNITAAAGATNSFYCYFL